MAKVTIVGDAMVVTSIAKLEDIKTLEKYAPKALSLFEKDEDGKKEEVFRVSTTTGDGSIGEFGASFASVTHDEAKLATITMCIPKGITDAKEYAAETIGKAVMALNKVEAQFKAALEGVEAEKKAVRENITIA